MPDVIILDLSLPGMGGIELTRSILQRAPAGRILIFSMHRNPLFATQAIRSGALGYITKSSSPEVLIQAVYKVASGTKMLSPDIAPPKSRCHYGKVMPIRWRNRARANSRFCSCCSTAAASSRSATSSTSVPRPCKTRITKSNPNWT
jgi:DNA-binding NarL/FixJ family response regulator